MFLSMGLCNKMRFVSYSSMKECNTCAIYVAWKFGFPMHIMSYNEHYCCRNCVIVVDVWDIVNMFYTACAEGKEST